MEKNERKYIIYMHKNKINNKMYIGQTCQNPPSKRWKPCNYKGSSRFYNAILKYGWINFEHIILKECSSLQEANQQERNFISQYQTTNPEFGYNIMPGGSNKEIPLQVREKMSKNHRNVKGKNNYFYGKHFKGKEHPFYGQHHSNETKQKLKESLLNKNGKAVKRIEENKIFPSAREAARYYNMKTSSHISACCNGKRQTANKFHWEYI